MTLVIFAYPLHFHIMQLAYKSALQAFDNVTNVVIMWDDLFVHRQHFKQHITECIPGAQVINMSALPECVGEHQGWLRQQYVKLNLHKLLPEDSWILLDADTVLRNSRPLIRNDSVLVYGDPWEHYRPYFEFIKHAVGIEKGNTPSFMSPYWLCERTVLLAIEQECMQLHGHGIVDVWKNYYKNINTSDSRALSEVELYGLFALKKLNKKFIFEKHNLQCCLKDKFLSLWNNPTLDLCLGGADNFSESFWADQGVKYFNAKETV